MGGNSWDGPHQKGQRRTQKLDVNRTVQTTNKTNSKQQQNPQPKIQWDRVWIAEGFPGCVAGAWLGACPRQIQMDIGGDGLDSIGCDSIDRSIDRRGSDTATTTKAGSNLASDLMATIPYVVSARWCARSRVRCCTRSIDRSIHRGSRKSIDPCSFQSPSSTRSSAIVARA